MSYTCVESDFFLYFLSSLLHLTTHSHFFSSSPEFPVVYQSDEEQERLMGLYQDLHSHLHHPTRPLRSFYRCSESENLLAWVSLAPGTVYRVSQSALASVFTTVSLSHT